MVLLHAVPRRMMDGVFNMGTSFFKSAGNAKAPSIHPSGGMNMEARAIGASSYSGRTAASSATKDLGAASAIAKAGAPKKGTGSAAYPKGPRI